MPKQIIPFIFCAVSLGLISCSSTINITGKYGTNFATGNFFGTTIIFKQNGTLEYTYGGDLIYHHLTGCYQVYGRKVFMVFDKELLDSNMASHPLFDDALYRKIYLTDTITYQRFCYIGNNKLFFAHIKTGKKVTKAFRYCKRRKYLFLGKPYYTSCKRRWYLARREG